MDFPVLHTDAVDTFLASAHWLTAEDAPAVATLRALAERLDTDPEPLPAMFSQYGLVYRALLKRSHGPSEKDPLEAMLDEAAGE